MIKINQLVLILFVFSSLVSFQQELLEPLGENPVLVRNKIGKSNINRDIDQNYIYAIDTISLPFVDDFSKDYFKKFNATPTDANVSDTLFHIIYNTVLPDSANAGYMLDTTYRYDITQVTIDSVSIDTIPLASLGFIKICDLDAYPVNCQMKEIWPAYNEYDTVGTVINPDNTFLVSNPDVTQDSALVYFVSATDTNSLWQDNHAYRNHDYGINPPTIGVVTFDGLNENGYPYDFGTAISYGKADYLTSKPIFMGQYNLVDSIYLSFYYQAQGLGNEPEVEDSLVLQFWSPNDNSWNNIWKKDGETLDSNFKKVMIKITDSKYLKDGFKFRFLNYSTLSGSFDHWNLDYVYLNSSRFSIDTNHDDVAFQYPMHTLLKNYTSMPWKHFKWNPTTFMLDSVTSTQQNINTNGRLVGDNDLKISYQGALQQTILNPNVPSIPGKTVFETKFDIAAVPYSYNVLVNNVSATFDIQVKHKTTPDFNRDNDTIFFNQILEDYYSLDDGTAEAAFGVKGLGAINPQIASQFELSQADTMKSIFVHFTPSAYNRSSTTFFFTIWDDIGGKPGNIIHQNTTLDVPRYNLGVNGFYEYPLDEKVNIPAGKYYVGWAQTTTDRINVGYDKNTNNRTRNYYNSSGTWNVSGFEGTLMIRPSFVYQKDYYTSIEKIEEEKIVIFPNPTNRIINIKTKLSIDNYSLVLIDVSGKIILMEQGKDKLDISNLNNGIYFLRMTNLVTNQTMSSKIIKN